MHFLNALLLSVDELNCTSRFMSESLLKLLVKKTQLTTLNEISANIAPDLRFTVGGLLQKWIFASGEDSELRSSYPHFRVWRKNGELFEAVDGTFTGDLDRVPTKSSQLNVYEYTLNPPAQVEAGDCIGWQHLTASSTRYIPLLLNNTGYEIFRIRSGGVLELQSYRMDPLISVQLLRKKNMHSLPTPTLSPLSHSHSPFFFLLSPSLSPFPTPPLSSNLLQS